MTMTSFLAICFVLQGVCLGFCIGYKIARRTYRNAYLAQLEEVRTIFERDRMSQIVHMRGGIASGLGGAAGSVAAGVGSASAASEPPPQRKADDLPNHFFPPSEFVARRGEFVDCRGDAPAEKKPEPKKPARHIEIETE